MSLKTVDLDSFSLVDSAEKLSLKVTAIADFRFPTSLSTLSADAVYEALTSGDMWVRRGNGCRIDIEFHLDGKPLEIPEHDHLMESLGGRIRDVVPWHRLSLLASLELSVSQRNSVSIAIKGSLPLGPGTEGSGSLLANNNVKPPDSVLCAEFERLQIKLSFLHVKGRERRVKISEMPVETEEPDVMLLDDSATEDTRPPDFHEVVEGMKGLPAQIAGSFILPMDQPNLNHIMLQAIVPMSRYETHALDEEDMLLDEPGDCQEFGCDEDEEMLFSQDSINTPSLTSESSIRSSTSVTSLGLAKAETNALDLHTPSPTSLLPLVAGKLIAFAITTLLGGHAIRANAQLSSIRVRKPPPQTPMVTLIPAMLCPGFTESMSQNAQYLPTISKAISISWPRNIQSPGLRRKLSQIASLDTLRDENHYANERNNITGRLASIVQARVWGMMQRRLFDGSAGRMIWRSSPASRLEVPGEEFEDLLDTPGIDGKHCTGDGYVEDEIDNDLLFSDEDEDEDDDMLFGEDDSERERLEIEHETDEMLFGDQWDDRDEGSDMLFTEESEGDSMLL